MDTTSVAYVLCRIEDDASLTPVSEHEDVEAHYACLERPHACMDGWVFVGRVVEAEHDLDGEVVEYVPCRRCADSR